jgi:hypothetical protein
MISRRFFLSGLLSVPAIVSVESRMPLRGVKMLRTRNAWRIVIHADGSTSWLNKQGQDYLDAWLDSEDATNWSTSGDDIGALRKMDKLQVHEEMPLINKLIEADKKEREERINHWQHFKEFQQADGVKVEAEFHPPGAVLRDDLKTEAKRLADNERNARLEIPTFQFSEKDWVSA